MRNLYVLLSFLLTASLTTSAQTLTVKKVVVTEYHVFYIASDNNVYSFLGGSSKVVQFPIGGRKAIDGAGGFNVFRILDDQGYIWTSYQNLTNNTTRFDTDSSGAAFNGNASVYAYENTSATIKTDGSVWYWGDDTFHLFHTSGGVNMRPMQLSPAGMVFKKLAIGGNRIVGLTTAGDVYEWTYSGSRTPTKKTIPLPALDIFASHMDYAGCIIPTSSGATSGYPYVWGYNYGCWGGSTTYSQPTSVQSLWKLTVPISVINANWNTTHFIDTLGRLFGMGYNVQGEVGTGVEYINKYNYPTFPGYGWDFTDGEDPVSTPVQIASGIKFSQLFSNNWFAFFKYAMDVNGNLYSWGRNKALALGNGYINLQEADHPNSMDVLVPTLVTPMTTTYQTYNWTAPSISAGGTQNILTNSCTLAGVATAPQLLSATTVAANGVAKVGYSIVSYQWTKVSGGNATITAPNSATTTVTGLSTGTYVFNLLTTDNNTGTQSANVTVNVTTGSSASVVSVAVSSTSLSTTLPTNTITLTGTATTTSGSITSYTWTQTSGPSTSTIDNRNNGTAYVSNLVAGTYVYKLTATDASGSSSSSNTTVVVNPAASTTPSTTYTVIPGTIQAENYTAMSGVGVETTTDVGGGQNVGWIDNGDWMSYNINATTAGTYTVTLRLSVPYSGAVIQIKDASNNILATVNPPASGGWQAWESVTTTVTLPAGNQTIKIVDAAATYSWNINWIQFAYNQPATTTYKAIPGLIQAEDYDAMSGVGVTTTTDVGGGQCVGWLDNGDWMSYNVNVATAGSYTMTLRLSVPYSGAVIQLKDASNNVLATVNPPASGGWQAWESVTATVILPAGNQTIKIVDAAATYSWNINWIQFAYNGPAVAGKVIPGTIQAEDYDSQFNTASQTTSDAGGGINLDYLTLGSYMNYNVTVQQAGTYTVGFRVATVNTGCKFQLRKSDGTVLTSFTLSSTGGYQTWLTYTATVTLAAGSQTLQVLSTATPYWNFNWMSFTLVSPTVTTANLQDGQAATIGAADQTSSQEPEVTVCTLFPNPVRDQFSLDIRNTMTGNVAIQVVSQGGQILKTYSFNKSTDESKFDMSASGLSAGVYFLQVRIANWTRTIKLLKVND